MDNLKDITSQLIDRYIDILEQYGEPYEEYKYLAINTFQDNWDIDSLDFHEMFKKSFSKFYNLLYKNSWGYINECANHFPKETREMFRALYNEDVDIEHRIKNFQLQSKKLLPKIKEVLNKENFNHQQDERTISVYLAFRFPNKYTLYKADYYKYFCEKLNISPRRTGERFLHLQELSTKIISLGSLENNRFINTYRSYYPNPNWDDRYLMIQNILYVTFNNKNAYSLNPTNIRLITSMNTHPLNQILYGAPGTGKTYNSKRIAVEIINGTKDRTRDEINTEYNELVEAKQIVFTTFHQSLSYEDFIEGIKPVIVEDDDENKSVIYEIKDGIFKEISKRAKERHIAIKNNEDVYHFDSAWNDLIDEINNSLQNNKQLELPIYTTGKGMLAIKITNQGNIKLIPKDSETDLEYTASYNRAKKLQESFPDLSIIKNIDKEFREVIGGSNSTVYWSILNYINYKIDKNKIKSKEIILPAKNHVIIIDEINRGNVSAIFGELITLLEEDKRKGNKEQIEVILPYSNHKYSVPNNLYIIGTMNTADRSVEALDTALRRRFSFVEMLPEPNLLVDSSYKDIDLSQLLTTINKRIEILIDKDHQIGHAYFLGIKSLDDLKITFRDNIIPLLEEYFYGDFGKIGLVLGGMFIYEEKNKDLFPKSFSYENDFIEDKKIYRYTLFEDWDENTFISIYED